MAETIDDMKANILNTGGYQPFSKARGKTIILLERRGLTPKAFSNNTFALALACTHHCGSVHTAAILKSDLATWILACVRASVRISEKGPETDTQHRLLLI